MADKEILVLLNENPLFKEFDDSEKERLKSSSSHILRFGNGEYIIHQGTAGSALFVLLGGTVAITRNEAPEVELCVLETGAIFGEVPMAVNSRRVTNAVAKGRAVVVKIDGIMFESLNPETLSKLNSYILKLFVNRLDAMNRRMAEVKAGLEKFLLSHEVIKGAAGEFPAASGELKIIQNLWSDYFNDLRTR